MLKVFSASRILDSGHVIGNAFFELRLMAVDLIFWVSSALGVLALTALAVEVACRLWLSKFYFVWAPYRSITLHHDLSVMPGADAVARIVINGLGERGEPAPRSWEGVYRVLVMGASAVECIALDQPNTWPEVLRRELAQNDRLAALGASAVHVGNIGKSLLPTSAQVRILEAIKPRYPRLDVIIFMVGASDLLAWLEEGAPEGRGAAPLDPHRIFNQSPADIRWHWRGLATKKVLAWLYYWAFKPVHVLDTYTTRIKARRLRRQNAHTIQSELPDCAGMVAQFEKDLVQLLAAARGVAKRIIVVRQPWLDQSESTEDMRWMGAIGGSVDSPEQGCYATIEALSGLMRRLDDVCQRVAERQNVEQVEVKSLIPADVDHYVDSVHFGVKGAKLIGTAVAAQVMRVKI